MVAGDKSHKVITQRCVISLWCLGMAGECVWVSVCPALSAHRDVRGPDLITASLPPPLPLLRSSIQTHTHTHTYPKEADQRKCSETVQYIRQWLSLKARGSCQCVVTWTDSWYRWIAGCQCDCPTIDLCVVRVPWCCDLYRKCNESGCGDWAVSHLSLKITSRLLAIMHTPCC